MTSKFSGLYIMIRGVILAAFVTVAGPAIGVASVGLPGDYNHNGFVSHSDYSVLGDTYGQTVPSFLGADGNGDGVVDSIDYAIYRDSYGQTASLPATLPLTVSAVPTPGGNLEWTFTFSNVNGALAGHLNISTNGPSILSVDGGPMFKDDGFNPLDAPGINASLAVQKGISFSGGTAFAALGTTLTQSPALLNSSSTLEFLRLVTAGSQPTTLTYAGEVGYQGQDYVHNGVASFVVPEPASWIVAGVCLAAFMAGPGSWRVRKQ